MAKISTRLRWLLTLAAVIGLGLVLLNLSQPQTQPGYGESSDLLSPLDSPTSGMAEATNTVMIGILDSNNYLIDFFGPKYSSDGYFWLKWDDNLQKKLVAADIKSDTLPEIVNQVQAWDEKIDAILPAQQLEDGSWYQQFKYSANFYINNLDFRRYPFGSLKLPISFELNDAASLFTLSKSRLIPDLRSSGLGGMANIDGYHLQGWQFRAYVHDYGSDFGLSSKAGEANEQYSQLIFNSVYTRSHWTAIWGTMQPLIVTLMIVIISPNLAGSLWEVRIALPTTVLLTLVFLQQGYKANLPELPYLTFIDKLYSLAYIVTLASFLLYLWGANLLDDAPDERRPSYLARINTIDKVVQVSLIGTLAIGGILAWYL